MARTKKAGEEKRNVERLWKDSVGTRILYDKMARAGARFVTLAGNSAIPAFYLWRMEPNPHGKSAVEFGPGQRPVSTELDFGRTTFVDVSREQAKELRKALQLRGINAEFVQGDIRSPPLKGMHSIAIANEVLTHLDQSEQKKAVEGLAKLADKVMICDRVQTASGGMNPISEWEISEALRKKGFGVLASGLFAYDKKRQKFFKPEREAGGLNVYRIILAVKREVIEKEKAGNPFLEQFK